MGGLIDAFSGIFGGGAKTPKAPQLPPAAPPAPTEVSPGVISARQKSRRQAASLAGATNITGGLTDGASTAKKSLLGT